MFLELSRDKIMIVLELSQDRLRPNSTPHGPSFLDPTLNLIIFNFHFWYHNHYFLNRTCNTCSLNSACAQNLACLLEVGQDAQYTICKFHKIQVFNLQGSITQECPSSVEVLQPYVKSSEGISRTSLRCGVFTRFAVKIFFLRFAQHKKMKKSLPMSYVRGQLLTCPQPRIPFFWFTSSKFCKRLVSFEVSAPASLFLRGSHMQRQYCKRTTYAEKAVPSKGYFTHPTLTNARKGR